MDEGVDWDDGVEVETHEDKEILPEMNGAAAQSEVGKLDDPRSMVEAATASKIIASDKKADATISNTLLTFYGKDNLDALEIEEVLDVAASFSEASLGKKFSFR